MNRGRVVKGVNFVNLTDAGDPVESAKFYEQEGADEIVFLDITASSDNRATMLNVVRKTAETVFLPFSVGGGIRSVDDIRNILSNGADKVSLNTAAVLKRNSFPKAQRNSESSASSSQSMQQEMLLGPTQRRLNCRFH